METNKNMQQQSGDFQIMDFLKGCLVQWRWFALSVVICLGIGAYKVLTTPPVYERSSTLLIKSDSKGKTTSSDNNMMDFASYGLMSSNTNVLDELEVLTSRTNVLEVVQRLGLNIAFYESSPFYDKLLYGSSCPISVAFEGLPDSQSASFKIKFKKDNNLELSDFTFKGDKIRENEIKCMMGDTVQTPFGKVCITPTFEWGTREFKDITVVHTPELVTVRTLLKVLTAELNPTKSKSFTQSSIILLHIKDICIARAEDILNTLVSVYNEKWLTSKNLEAVNTAFFINERLALLEKELEGVDSDISKYKADNLTPDIKTASSIYFNQNTALQNELLTLNNEMYMAQYIKDYLNDGNNKYALLPANTGITEGNIESQMSEYNTILMDRNRLVSSTSERNPLVMDLEEQLAGMRQAIKTSIDNQIISLNSQINNLKATESKTQELLASNPGQEKFLSAVERQQKVKEALYLFLLQKREENELSKAFSGSNTRLIDPPGGSNIPVEPSAAKILLIALILGLCIPAGILYLIEMTNTKVTSKKDLANLTVPILGELPYAGGKKNGRFRKDSDIPKQIVVKAGSRNYVNEAFRVLRTNLEFVCQEKQHCVIANTSIRPGSGKSFVTANMGVCLAIRQKKVLIIDGDFRHTSLSEFVDLPKIGFASYLGGSVKDIDECIIKNALVDNLDVLPVGAIPPNPTELISSDKFREAIENLKTMYDYVIIDCPPIDIVADAQIVNACADRTIFLIRAGLFDKAMIPELQDIYDQKKLVNMSLIINAVDHTGGRYGYYGKGYGHYYNHYYGHYYSHYYHNNDGESNYYVKDDEEK